MKNEAAITASVDVETLALVDRLALAKGMTGAQYAAEAIRRVAESDDDLLAFIQEGIGAADRGEFVSHEEVMAELDAMVAKHEARCRE